VDQDATYTTPMYHHNPMEPHTTIAIWTDDGAHPLGRVSEVGGFCEMFPAWDEGT
jgi:CO/xanthine dehydrogenase Mo-binding subunit